MEASGRLETDGRTLAWRELGKGPPLVLLNGFAATALDWDPLFVAGLARRHRVICLDNRGMGDSDLGDGDFDVAAMAADALAATDALELDAVAVAGWSMGGFIGQAMAAAAPERVSCLALVSTDAGGRGAVLPRPGVNAALRDTSGTPREQATRLIGLLFPPGFAEEFDRRFGDAVAEARAALDPRAAASQWRAVEAWHATEPDPVPADVPVLAAHGLEDRVIPAINSTLFDLDRPDVWHAPFTGCGHALMAQVPGRLAALIAAFATG